MSYRKLTHACARHQRRPAGKLSTKEKAVMRRANTIVRKRFRRLAVLESPGAAHRFLTLQLGLRQSEVFCAIWLDTRHRVLKFEELFQGTIDGAVVHPREVVRRALIHNAAAVIFAHSHPSGNPEPSSADIKLTHRLREALDLVEIRILDHIVVGGTETVSLSRRGLL